MTDQLDSAPHGQHDEKEEHGDDSGCDGVDEEGRDVVLRFLRLHWNETLQLSLITH